MQVLASRTRMQMTDRRQLSKVHYSQTENTKLKHQTRKTQEQYNKQEYKRETEQTYRYIHIYFLLYSISTLYCSVL